MAVNRVSEYVRVLAYAGLAALLLGSFADAAIAGCGTTATSVSAVPSSVSFSTSTQTLTLGADVKTNGVTSGNGNCSRGVVPVTDGQVTFTVTNSLSVVIGVAVTSATPSLTSPIFSASYTLPANTPAGTYTLTAAYSASAGTGANFNANSSGTGTFSVTVATNSDMSVSLSGMPATATVGVGYSGSVVCTNSSTAGTAAANTATCSASGLPTGLTLGTCTPPSPVSSLASGATITCPVTGTPTGAGTASVSGATGATNDVTVGNNTASLALAVGKGTQTVSFTKPADTPFTSTPPTLAATASSGLAVTYTSTTGPVCTVTSAGVITFVTAGSCSITASQAGNAKYAAATPVSRSFNVTPGTVTLQLATLPSVVQISQTVVLTATASPSTATGSISFSEGGVTLCANVPMVNGTATCAAKFSTSGTHSVSAAYSGSSNYTAVTSTALTITVNDSVARTAAAIGKFLSQRNNQIITNEPDAGRQIDRLIEASGGDGSPLAPSGGNASFSNNTPHSSSSRLGAGPDVGDVGRLRFGSGLRERYGDGLASLGMPSSDGNPFPQTPPTGGRFADETPSGGSSLIAGPVRITGNTEGTATLGFTTSLRDMYRIASEAQARKATDGAFGLGAARGPAVADSTSPFDVWIEGKFASFRDTRVGNDLDGHFGLLTIGADYVLNPKLLVGTLIQFDSMRQRAVAQGTDVAGKGFMAGPYATLRLSEHLFLQGRVAWGHSFNEISPYLTYTDRFLSERWLASTTLVGRWNLGAWSLRPSASVSYIEDTAKSYSDVYGAQIPSVKSQLGQAKVGPEVSYKYQLDPDLFVQPRAGVQVIWNFAGGTVADGLGSLTNENSGPHGARGRAELGLKIGASTGVSVDISGSHDGIGTSGYRSTTGKAMVRIPFN